MLLIVLYILQIIICITCRVERILTTKKLRCEYLRNFKFSKKKELNNVAFTALT